jgi:uncharacterized protein DUF4177
MTKWEYRILKFSPSGAFFRGGKIPDEWLAEQLNSFGADGWEAVSTFTSAVSYGATQDVAILLKRPTA